MNERIKELAEQARLGRGPEKIRISENGVVIFYLDELEKFAELILQDIDKLVDDLYHLMPLEQAAVLLTLDENIKEHFYGVEK